MLTKKDLEDIEIFLAMEEVFIDEHSSENLDKNLDVIKDDTQVIDVDVIEKED